MRRLKSLGFEGRGLVGGGFCGEVLGGGCGGGE